MKRILQVRNFRAVLTEKHPDPFFENWDNPVRHFYINYAYLEESPPYDWRTTQEMIDLDDEEMRLWEDGRRNFGLSPVAQAMPCFTGGYSTHEFTLLYGDDARKWKDMLKSLLAGGGPFHYREVPSSWDGPEFVITAMIK